MTVGEFNATQQDPDRTATEVTVLSPEPEPEPGISAFDEDDTEIDMNPITPEMLEALVEDRRRRSKP